MNNFKEVLPRLYNEVKNFVDTKYPQYQKQLENLYITGRCDCGSHSCVQFYLESSDPKVAPIEGRRPLYMDIDNIQAPVMLGFSGHILTGLEVLGDYSDEYINNQLIKAGFPQVIDENY